MAGAFHQLAIPPVANAEDIAHFEQCFSDAIELNATVQAAFKNYGTFMNQARELVIEADKKLVVGSSRVSGNITFIADRDREFIFQCVAAAGLKCFAPDIMGSCESMYNLVHERVAIHTFQTIAAMGGYAFMGCAINFTKMPALMTQMYRSFQYSRLKGIVLKELKQPGRVQAETSKNSATRRRSDVF